MSDEQTKPHFSASQLELITKCGEAYRRRYIEGEKIPPGIRQLKGKAVHAAAELNFTQKYESGKDLPWRQMVDIAVAALETEVGRGVLLDPFEEGRGYRTIVSEAQQETVDLAEAHAGLQAPKYHPAHMPEMLVQIELPGPRDFVGVLDLQAMEAGVVDFKNGRKSRQQADVDGSIQLTGYAALYRAAHGELPERMVVDQLVTSKSGDITRKTVVTSREPRDIQALARLIDVANRVVETGTFLPSVPGRDWWCSARWCGFWRSCPYVTPRSLKSSDDEE